MARRSLQSKNANLEPLNDHVIIGPSLSLAEKLTTKIYCGLIEEIFLPMSLCGCRQLH